MKPPLSPPPPPPGRAPRPDFMRRPPAWFIAMGLLGVVGWVVVLGTLVALALASLGVRL